jgi:hypothetical protein
MSASANDPKRLRSPIDRAIALGIALRRRFS